jgi:hypothetical protein
MPTRIVVCADDYAFTPGVSQGIRELLAAGRISATSVMAASEFWPDEAPALKAVAGRADIGLHVTLTDQMPLGAMPAFAPNGRFPPMGAVMKAGLLHRLPLAEIEAEIERQIERFVVHYGAAPAHIDGHHHVQQLPGVRDIVVRAAARLGTGHTWVRCGHERPGLIARRRVAAPKALMIGALGPGIRRRAARAGVPINRGFSGAYDFINERRPMAVLFAAFLDGCERNSLIFCHPGHADAALAQRDIMTTAREAELAFLASEAWSGLLAARALEVGPLLRGP